MVAPVCTENALGRYVHLPESMLYWGVGDYREKELELIPAGDHWIPVEMDRIPLFIRPQGVLVLASHAENEAAQDYRELEAVAFMTENALSYRLYWDDGIAAAPERASSGALKLEICRNNQGYSVELTAHEICPVERMQIYIIDKQGVTTKVEVDRS